MLDVAGHPDDRVFLSVEGDRAADRVAAGEIAAREGFIDDGDGRRAGPVGRAELAAPHADLERGEESRTNVVREDHELLAGNRRPSFDLEARGARSGESERNPPG